MKTRLIALVMTVAIVASVSVSFVFATPAHAASVNTYTGSIDGAAYRIQVPQPWNGTLVLYSHGYVVPGANNPATDVGDAATGAWLLAHGYALAGSSYSTTGWALQQAFHDQIALLDYFDTNIGQPTQTIAWGHSLGGIITAGLVQLYPERFVGALPMCGVVAGGVGTWNTALDGAFALNTLLAGNNPLQVVHITNPNVNLGHAEQLLAAAQATPQGRARIALAAALSDVPGWYQTGSPEPAATDYAGQEANQELWLANVDGPFEFAFRAELEARAGGNPSWNTGVDYRHQLAISAEGREVENLYNQAGLNLNTDLAALNSAQRISPDESAVNYLKQYISFNGQISIPVLTMHTTGDGLVINQNEQSYASVVRSAGNANLLRETFVHRAGHCAFTPAETITAFQTLVHRIKTGKWGDSTNAALMNSEASALGATYNVAPPAFLHYEPSAYPRPYVLRGEESR